MIETACSVAMGWSEVRYSSVLIGTIALAGLGTTILFLLGAVAYYRRRSLPYLLIAVSMGALAARSIVGFGTVMGVVPMGAHHLIEHGLDFLIAVLLLAAITTSGTVGMGGRNDADEP